MGAYCDAAHADAASHPSPTRHALPSLIDEPSRFSPSAPLDDKPRPASPGVQPHRHASADPTRPARHACRSPRPRQADMPAPYWPALATSQAKPLRAESRRHTDVSFLDDRTSHRGRMPSRHADPESPTCPSRPTSRSGSCPDDSPSLRMPLRRAYPMQPVAGLPDNPLQLGRLHRPRPALVTGRR